MEHGPFIGDLPIESGGSFHSYVSLTEGRMNGLRQQQNLRLGSKCGVFFHAPKTALTDEHPQKGSRGCHWLLIDFTEKWHSLIIQHMVYIYKYI